MRSIKYILIGVLIAMSQVVIGSESDSSESGDQWKLLEVKSKEYEEVWFFRKSMNAPKAKKKDQLATLVYFTVEYTPRDPSGLPNKKDAELLYSFEEEVIPEVEKEANCLMVASVVKGGIKDHLFYVSDPEKFLSSIGKYKSKLANLSVSLEKVDDPEWEVYADFPDGK